MDYRKLLSWCEFVQKLNAYRNEKCVDHPKTLPDIFLVYDNISITHLFHFFILDPSQQQRMDGY